MFNLLKGAPRPTYATQRELHITAGNIREDIEELRQSIERLRQEVRALQEAHDAQPPVVEVTPTPAPEPVRRRSHKKKETAPEEP